MSENRVIGRNNQIPWRLPADFKWFKEKTLGNVVVMGRKTFESLPRTLIPNRRKLILTRHPQVLRRNPIFKDYHEWRSAEKITSQYQLRFTKIDGDEDNDIRVFNSLDKINPDDFNCDVFICGGAEVYAQALPICSDVFLTIVKRTVEGDAFFPIFEDRFEVPELLRDERDFKILHYRNKSP